MAKKMTVEQMRSTYQSLGESFNAEFVEEVSMEDIDSKINQDFAGVIDGNKEVLAVAPIDTIGNVKSALAILEEKKDNLENALVTAKIKDAHFLETEIKGLILSSKNVLGILEKDIKIGAQPRMYEVYATLLNAITSQYKELRNLNESIAKYVINNQKVELEGKKEDNKMITNTKDALAMYQKAKGLSQMEAVETDFDIVDVDEEDK